MADTKPIILAVDDETPVLRAVERDLRRQYGGTYRIVGAGSGREALETVRALKQRNSPVALFLADQRMPDMSGTEFLAEARKFYPEAGKVLLTAYADTEAAIASINQVGLDHYLMKPWDPPEELLYPVLDDLLEEWAATVDLPYQGIRVAGTLWSPSSHAVKDFLSRNRVPYQWLDIERDPQALALVEALQEKKRRLPVIFFPEGEPLIEPEFRDLADRVGLVTQAAQPFYDLIIVGAGPAGLAAAVYGASEALKTVLVEKEATGGQAGTSSFIENYLGFPRGLSGAELARRATAQARKFGVEILTAQEATSVRVEDPYRFVRLSDGTELSCHALLIATGVSIKQLDTPGVLALSGAGVYYGAALTEAAHYRDQEVIVIGGANSAGQGALFFSRYARKVTMLVRGSSLTASMSQYLIDQIAGTKNIAVLTQTQVAEAKGSGRLEAVAISNSATGEVQTLPAAAMFIFIGAVPLTDLAAGVVERDRTGFILTGRDLPQVNGRPRGWRLKRDPLMLETSVPGIFAAGDVRHGSPKRVSSAVGEGSVAVHLIHQYLRTV